MRAPTDMIFLWIYGQHKLDLIGEIKMSHNQMGREQGWIWEELGERCEDGQNSLYKNLNVIMLFEKKNINHKYKDLQSVVTLKENKFQGDLIVAT